MDEHLNEKPHVGGQAVIEGVMIRNRYVYSVAVRKQDGTIEIKKEGIHSPAQRYRVLRMPFVRGIIVLFENLVLGIRSLLYSAEIAMPEDNSSKKRKGSTDIFVFFGIIPALLLGVGLFIVIPNIGTHYLGIVENETPFLFNLIAGVIRLTLFFLYVIIISMIRDIRRTFEYHGAEHKSIFCYEANKPLIIEEAKTFKTLHPRCGTSFLFLVFFITIIVFPLITVGLDVLYKDFTNLRLILRKIITISLHIIVALPIIASFSYELLKLTDRFKSNFFMKVLIAPGLLLQRITTREPDDQQLEVALEALKSVL